MGHINTGLHWTENSVYCKQRENKMATSGDEFLWKTHYTFHSSFYRSQQVNTTGLIIWLQNRHGNLHGECQSPARSNGRKLQFRVLLARAGILSQTPWAKGLGSDSSLSAHPSLPADSCSATFPATPPPVTATAAATARLISSE